ncbi:MAG TPA: tripartite tricarboxylate transporter substrate binding protein [Geminicoccaceae bacterium]|nr:tripartite tricarboxylate transporter substrate binding protein [Geminicoccaceae bacterium]
MRKLLVSASVLGFATMLAAPLAAFEPGRTECIAPAQPGGGFDLTCRIAAEALIETGQIQQPMQVTFMPGGIGAVAYNHMNTRRKADENVIVAFSGGSLLNLAQGKFGQFDESNARWVASAGADYGAVVVRADAPWQTLTELVDALKADPRAIIFGAGGTVGSQDWMKAAIVAKAAGLEPNAIRYVAFEGGGESYTNLLGGHIHVYTGDISEQKANLEAGQVRVLAVMADERLPEPFGEIPTAKEQGLDVEWAIIRGYYMGPEVSDDAYNWWVAAFKAMYEKPEYAKILEEKGLFEFSLAGAEFDAYVKEQVESYRSLAREAGLLQ